MEQLLEREGIVQKITNILGANNAEKYFRLDSRIRSKSTDLYQ